MTTVQSWVDQTRNMLLSGYVEELDTLTSDISTSVTAIPLQGLSNGIARGVIIEIDSEQMYVSIATSATNPTVIRGYGGSTIAAHTNGALVRVSPKFPTDRIIDSINNDLNDLSSPDMGLFQMKTISFDYVAGVQGYNLSGLTNDVVSSIYDVSYANIGIAANEPDVISWELKRNRATSSFASGLALILYSGALSGRKVTVMYKSPLSTVTNLSTTKASTGLLPAAYDIVPLGAAAHLMTTMPIRREFLDAQGTSRLAADVPPGAISAGSRDLYARRSSRVKSEAMRLIAMYPQQYRRNTAGRSSLHGGFGGFIQ